MKKGKYLQDMKIALDALHDAPNHDRLDVFNHEARRIAGAHALSIAEVQEDLALLVCDHNIEMEMGRYVYTTGIP